jgi:hypothetical protein
MNISTTVSSFVGGSAAAKVKASVLAGVLDISFPKLELPKQILPLVMHGIIILGS